MDYAAKKRSSTSNSSIRKVYHGYGDTIAIEGKSRCDRRSMARYQLSIGKNKIEHVVVFFMGHAKHSTPGSIIGLLLGI